MTQVDFDSLPYRMKQQLTLLILILFTIPVFAQERLPIEKSLTTRLNPDAPGMLAKDAIKHIGSEVYIRDTISRYRIVNPSLTLLYMGDKNTNRILTIHIKGKDLNKKLALIRSGVGHFSGKVIIYKRKPAIIITDKEQASIRILI